VAAAFPEIGDEILELFGELDSPAEAGALFDYVFEITAPEATGTHHAVVALRLRNSDERLAAKTALKAKKRIERVHSLLS
jgi:hypothetical protein